MENRPQYQEYDGFTVKIKMPSQYKDIELEMLFTAVVGDLHFKVAQILATEYKQPNCKLRFIFNGKLLQPDSATLQSFSIGNGSYLHAVVNSNPMSQSATMHPPRANNEISRDASLLSNLSVADNNQPEVGQLDRNISILYIDHRNAPLQIENATWDDEEESQAVANPNMFWVDFAGGFVIGLFLGVLGAYCMWERSLNSQHKAGLSVGIMIQLLFNIYGTVNETENAVANSKSESSGDNSAQIIVP